MIEQNLVDNFDNVVDDLLGLYHNDFEQYLKICESIPKTILAIIDREASQRDPGYACDLEAPIHKLGTH